MATQVPTKTNGGISADGLTYKLTIRTGVMWNTTPARQVTAADVVRGLERTCNPAQPFGGLPDFESLIQGMEAFCAGFAKVAPNAAAIKNYIDNNSMAGASVDPSNPQTVVYKLNNPATYFVDQLAMPAFSAAPVEFLNYVPASAALAQHTLSDGPYQIQSYTPTKSIVFVRNPAWNASYRPDPEGLRQPGQCQRDRQPAIDPAADPDQLGLGRHGLGRWRSDLGHPRSTGEQQPAAQPGTDVRHQPLRTIQRSRHRTTARPWPTSRFAKPLNTASTAPT